MQQNRFFIANPEGQILAALPLVPETTIAHLKEAVQKETGIAAATQHLFFGGQELSMPHRTVGSYNVKPDDIVLLASARGAQQLSGFSQPLPIAPAVPDPASSSTQSTARPLQSPMHPHPLAWCVPYDGRTWYCDACAAPQPGQQAYHCERCKFDLCRSCAESFKGESIAATPDLSPAFQRQVEERIRLKNVQENLDTAMEYHPETLSETTMLYVPCEVNKVLVNAFVDTGAQCADRCGLTRLIDPRFAGIARGVGSARIIGKVHLAPIKIGNSYFPSSFTILEQQDMDFLLGLDLLRKFRAHVDLETNSLRIGKEVVPFLTDNDGVFEAEETAFGSSAPHTHPSSSSSSAPLSSSSPSDPAFQAKVEQLEALGFAPRSKVAEALAACDGNTEAAANRLVQGG